MWIKGLILLMDKFAMLYPKFLLADANLQNPHFAWKFIWTVRTNYKQDQGSKAPSSHTSFYPCLPFYQVYLSILSFAPCTFLPIWPHIIIYHRIPQTVYLLNLSFAPYTVLPSLSFYQVYLLNLSFVPSIPKYHNCQKIEKVVKNSRNCQKMSKWSKNVKMVKKCQNSKTKSTKRLSWSDQLISWIRSGQLIW